MITAIKLILETALFIVLIILAASFVMGVNYMAVPVMEWDIFARLIIVIAAIVYPCAISALQSR